MEGTARKILPELTGKRPLLGITILLVEDSRYCAEAVRLMSQRSGSRLRRADSLRAARRHLAIYRPDVVMIDLGLPDGSGVDLIRELHKAGKHAPGIVAVSDDEGGSACAGAMEEGANCFMAKPLVDISSFQQAIRRIINKEQRAGYFVPQVVKGGPQLDARAFVDDLGHVGGQLGEALQGNDRTKLRYLAQFTRSIAQTARDHELMDSASAFMVRLGGGRAWHKAGERVLGQVQDRLADVPEI